jgi:hypothetical protein
MGSKASPAAFKSSAALSKVFEWSAERTWKTGTSSPSERDCSWKAMSQMASAAASVGSQESVYDSSYQPRLAIVA